MFDNDWHIPNKLIYEAKKNSAENNASKLEDNTMVALFTLTIFVWLLSSNYVFDLFIIKK